MNTITEDQRDTLRAADYANPSLTDEQLSQMAVDYGETNEKRPLLQK